MTVRSEFAQWGWKRYVLAERGMNDWTDGLYASARRDNAEHWKREEHVRNLFRRFRPLLEPIPKGQESEIRDAFAVGVRLSMQQGES